MQELKCPLDDFEILYFTAGAKGKSFVFCPYCYNNPPFPDMRKDSGCNSCTHPTCQHGQVRKIKYSKFTYSRTFQTTD